MKELNITQPVIDKCKQIAELWRMEIYVGCWVYIYSIPSLRLVQNKSDFQPYQHIIDDKMGFPVPSISDCLEKLREIRGDNSYSGVLLRLNHFLHGHITLIEFYEYLLSALLEVLKNSNA